MLVEICTLFPEAFASFFSTGLLGRSVEGGILSYRLHNMRPFGKGPYRSVDDAPFGGGAGMLLTYDAVSACLEKTVMRPRVFLSPRGKQLSVSHLTRWQEAGGMTLLCGHYEGIDQRVLDQHIDEEVCVGQVVLNGGELPAQICIEALARRLPGFLKQASLHVESFDDGTLEHDQYTRPREAGGAQVPPVLLEGDPKPAARWARENALFRTWQRRPDLFSKLTLTDWEFEAIHGKIRTQYQFPRQDLP